MSGTLALASAIAEMDRDTLAALVRSRRPHAHASISDPIGLASDLLKPDSIARALAPLDRAQLAAVRDPRSADSARIEQLRGLGLVGRDGDAAVALPEVEAVLDDALAAAGSGDAPRAAGALPTGPEAGPDPDPDSDPDTSVWFTSALTAVGQAAECLRLLRDRPGKLNRSGSIAVATVKHLAEATAIEPDEVTLALAALLRADLIAALADDQLLIAASGSGSWLASAHVERWIALARAAALSMPAPLRAEWAAAARPSCDVRALAAAVPEEYPLLPAADLAAVADFARLAEYLGLTVAGRCTDIADALLARDGAGVADPRGAGDADVVARVAAAMPETAAGVYVQPDLSVVVPGPLPPRDEAVLVALARPEHIGVASTRRISEASIAGAYERGLTPATAREAFARISLTGIPQPLEYLLGSLGERIGGIVVSEHHGDEGRTRLAFARAELAATILVDRTLQHLQLHRTRASETELFSRLSPDHVLAALADARYHASSGAAALHEAEGALDAPPEAARTDEPEAARTDEPGADAVVAPSTGSGTASSDAAGAAASAADPDRDRSPSPQEALVDRVFTAARSEPGTGDFTRRLELAIRDRSPVRVTAESRGEVRTFTLLPVSVSAGRLRAADQSAGVERTLPITLITAVESV